MTTPAPVAALEPFAAQLSQLADLSPEDLSALETQLIDAFDQADQADDEEALGALADALDQVRTEMGQRGDAPAEEPPMAAAAESEPADPAPAAEAPGDQSGADPAPDAAAPAAEGTDPEADAPAADPTPALQEGTPVTTSTTVVVPRENEPVVAAAMSRVLAGADIPGFSVGSEIANREEFGKLLSNRINALSRGNNGNGEQTIIASIFAPDVPERTLSKNDPEGNLAKIEALTHPDAITAAGGCCAPLETRYDLFDCGGVTDRPVKDALAGFRAERGGIRFYRGPALADIAGSLGFWTCVDDAAADVNDSSTWKVCGRINCPDEETAELQAITMCLTFGVLQQRVFPELAVANNKLAMVAQARLADAALLAQIKAGSTRVNDSGTPMGAVRDLLQTVARAAMYFRDRYRITGVNLRAIIPVWVLEVLRGDHILGPVNSGSARQHFGISDAEIAGFFADRGINVTWALDSANPASNGGGFFNKIDWTPGDATGAGLVPGVLPAFPTTIEWALYPEGTWLHLDGGQLDLGVIRDSALVRTNDYMEFSETFEAAANIGCESLWITSTVNVSGAYACCV